MEKKYDVTALGELLIDFAVNGESEQGNQLFEACPGGAPCNVLAMLNKLGRKTAFICSRFAVKRKFSVTIRESMYKSKCCVDILIHYKSLCFYS